MHAYWYPRCIKHFLTQLISSPLNSTSDKGQTGVNWSFYDDMLILDDHSDDNEDVDSFLVLFAQNQYICKVFSQLISSLILREQK